MESVCWRVYSGDCRLEKYLLDNYNGGSILEKVEWRMYNVECMRRSEYRRVYTGDVLLEPESMDSGTPLQSRVLKLQRCIPSLELQSCIIIKLLSQRVAEAYQGVVK